MSRQHIRDWILLEARIDRCDLHDGTPLLADRLITSFQLVELILYVESLRGQPIDEARLVPECFRDIDTIARNFLEPGP
jgi:hypothetical protein